MVLPGSHITLFPIHYGVKERVEKLDTHDAVKWLGPCADRRWRTGSRPKDKQCCHLVTKDSEANEGADPHPDTSDGSFVRPLGQCRSESRADQEKPKYSERPVIEWRPPRANGPFNIMMNN